MALPTLAALMHAADRPKPELQVLSPAQYNLVFYFIVLAGFAMLASFLRTWSSRGEVSARYRPALFASLCITAVAAVSYLVLTIKWDTGYNLVNGAYQPTPEAEFTMIPRYMDWSVTVPLLTVELLAVCAVVGAKARNLRFTTMAAAFLMILTGYLGAAVFDDGRSTTALWIWGLISTAFYVYLYVALWGAVRTSTGAMSGEAFASLRNAAILLLSVWGAYPLMYAVRVFFEGPEWTTTMQVVFSAADITAKVGFAALIHKVAKLRTAEDVASGEDTHPETVWTSHVKRSEGVQPDLRGIIHAIHTDGASHDGNPAPARTTSNPVAVAESFDGTTVAADPTTSTPTNTSTPRSRGRR